MPSTQGPPAVDLERATLYAQLDPSQLAGLVTEAIGLHPDTPEGARIGTALAELVEIVDGLHDNQDSITQRTADGLAALASRLIGPVNVWVETDEGSI